MAEIHPTAIVSPKANLADSVVVGAYSVVGAGVSLGENVALGSHVVMDGGVEVGKNTKIYPFAVIGMKPQSSSYGKEGRIRIGADVEIREHVTIHLGTEKDSSLTSVGDHTLLMVGVHIAHDCRIGSHVTIANLTTFAGHCVVEDHALIGGLATAKQFTRIGKHALVSGKSGLAVDVPPFGAVFGLPAKHVGINRIGLQRHGFSRERIHAIRKAFKVLYEGEGLMTERLASLEADCQDSPDVLYLLNFLREKGKKPAPLLEES